MRWLSSCARTPPHTQSAARATIDRSALARASLGQRSSFHRRAGCAYGPWVGVVGEALISRRKAAAAAEDRGERGRAGRVDHGRAARDPVASIQRVSTLLTL